jgi:hypothetical protein
MKTKPSKIEMHWEFDFFRRMKGCIFSLDINHQSNGDHSPHTSIMLCMFGFKVFEVSRYNAFHVDDDEILYCPGCGGDCVDYSFEAIHRCKLHPGAGMLQWIEK